MPHVPISRAEWNGRYTDHLLSLDEIAERVYPRLGVPITKTEVATGGNLRRVQKLSRHAHLRTLSIYDENRRDFQGEVTGILSGPL